MAVRGGPKIVTDDLIFYLDADEIKSYPGSGNSWFDLSNNGHTATLVNTPTFSGGIFDLEPDAHFTIGATSTLGYEDSLKYSVSIWFSWESTTGSTSNRQYLWDNRGATGSGYYAVVIDNTSHGDPGLKTIYSGGSELSAITTLPSFDVWVNFCGTFNRDGGGFTDAYVNGKFITQDTGTPGSTNNRGGFIGKFAGTGYQFDGQIAMVSIYTKILDASEVKQNYDAHKWRFDLS